MDTLYAIMKYVVIVEGLDLALYTYNRVRERMSVRNNQHPHAVFDTGSQRATVAENGNAYSNNSDSRGRDI